MKLYTEKSAAGMESAPCPTQQGSLPGACAPLAFPYIPMQCKNPKQYDRREALQQGTLFPGLDLPFQKELKSRFPAVNSALSELMALDFAVDELGLYLTTMQMTGRLWSCTGAILPWLRRDASATRRPTARFCRLTSHPTATAGSMIRGLETKEEIADVCI